MPLSPIALLALLASLLVSACEQKNADAPRPAAKAVAKVEPQRPPAPAPSRDSVRIGPNGVAIETVDPKREGHLEIAFPKR